MNTEKIINEWFYRLPNGYANYPYSDKELNVTRHDVLEENDFQLDQAFLDAKPVEEPEAISVKMQSMEELADVEDIEDKRLESVSSEQIGSTRQRTRDAGLRIYIILLSDTDLENALIRKIYSSVRFRKESFEY